MVYPKKISEWLELAPSSRSVEGDSRGIGRAANFQCGCVIRFVVETEQNGAVISQHETNGCGYMRAAAALIERSVTGRSVVELGGLAKDGLSDLAESELGRAPDDRASCLEAVIHALQEAFADHRRKRIEGSGSDKALICTCFGITEDRIRDVIASGPSCGVDDVKGATNAGRGCGSCLMLIEEMVQQAKAEMDF